MYALRNNTLDIHIGVINFMPISRKAGGWIDELRSFGKLPIEAMVKLAQFDVASPNYEK